MNRKKEWPITVRLEEADFQYISHLATTDDRSLSVLARYLIRRGMDQHKKDGKLFEPPPPEPEADPKATPGETRPGKKRATNG